MKIHLAETSVEQQMRQGGAAIGLFGKGFLSSPVIFPSRRATSGASNNFLFVATVQLLFVMLRAIDLHSYPIEKSRGRT